MKVTRSEITPITPRLHPDNAPAARKSGPARQAAHPAQLSETLQELNQNQALLANTPEVDLDKVARLRQAIAEGRLPLDLDALSNVILDLHRS